MNVDQAIEQADREARTFVQQVPSAKKPVEYLLKEAREYHARGKDDVARHSIEDIETVKQWARTPEYRFPPRASLPGERKRGDLAFLPVYTVTGHYASFPEIRRTATETVLVFPVQPVPMFRGWRRSWNWHPHGQQFASPCWAVSMDEGGSWDIRREEPAMGDLIVSTRSPLACGAPRGVRPGEAAPPDRPGLRLHPFDYARCPDGSALAATYTGRDEHGPGTLHFARWDAGSSAWVHVCTMENATQINYEEPALYTGRDGRMVCMIRTSYDYSLPREKIDPEALNNHGQSNDAGPPGYGWYFFQSESTDNGRTWSTPQRTGIWGHPADLLRLASGEVLMVYGHRKPPYTVRAVLSHDDGRTWDIDSIRTLHTFEPSQTDFGYPVVTQYEDGTILTAFYGYSSTDVAPWGGPHGIFVCLFDEQWLKAAQ